MVRILYVLEILLVRIVLYFKLNVQVKILFHCFPQKQQSKVYTKVLKLLHYIII